MILTDVIAHITTKWFSKVLKHLKSCVLLVRLRSEKAGLTTPRNHGFMNNFITRFKNKLYYYWKNINPPDL